MTTSQAYPGPGAPANQDAEHLHLLSIFHYVVGTLLALFSLLPVLHLIAGIYVLSQGGEEAWFGIIFVVMALVFIVCGESLAVCTLLSARFLRQRRRYWFSFVISCILCIFMPFGTILGIFTIITLSRPSVKQAYGIEAPPAPA